MIQRKEELKNEIQEIEYKEIMKIHKYPKRHINEVWRKVRRDRDKIKRCEEFDIYKENYQDLMKKIEVDIYRDLRRKNKKIDNEDDKKPN